MSDYRTRLDKRSKKKTNSILNIMIGVVVLLILIVGTTIFLSNGENKNTASNEVTSKESNEEASTNDKNSEENAKKEDKQDDSINNSEKEASDASSNNDKEENSSESEEKNNEIAGNAEDKSKLEIEESNEPNVKKSIVHPDWKPVGTKQTGEHVSQYDGNSVDWQEKVKALSYATGIPEENMTVWYIEGNGGPQKSIGTVSAKDGSVVYRVYLQWVDGQGWKPAKMQELVENDKD